LWTNTSPSSAGDRILPWEPQLPTHVQGFIPTSFLLLFFPWTPRRNTFSNPLFAAAFSGLPLPFFLHPGPPRHPHKPPPRWLLVSQISAKILWICANCFFLSLPILPPFYVWCFLMFLDHEFRLGSSLLIIFGAFFLVFPFFAFSFLSLFARTVSSWVS